MARIPDEEIERLKREIPIERLVEAAGHPWYALQQHSDGGVLWQFTGYRHEIDDLAARLAITPEELPPISEQDFFARCAEL
jgi:hypothetical protein